MGNKESRKRFSNSDSENRLAQNLSLPSAAQDDLTHDDTNNNDPRTNKAIKPKSTMEPLDYLDQTYIKRGLLLKMSNAAAGKFPYKSRKKDMLSQSRSLRAEQQDSPDSSFEDLAVTECLEQTGCNQCALSEQQQSIAISSRINDGERNKVLASTPKSEFRNHKLPNFPADQLAPIMSGESQHSLDSGGDIIITYPSDDSTSDHRTTQLNHAHLCNSYHSATRHSSIRSKKELFLFEDQSLEKSTSNIWEISNLTDNLMSIIVMGDESLIYEMEKIRCINSQKGCYGNEIDGKTSPIVGVGNQDTSGGGLTTPSSSSTATCSSVTCTTGTNSLDTNNEATWRTLAEEPYNGIETRNISIYI